MRRPARTDRVRRGAPHGAPRCPNRLVLALLAIVSVGAWRALSELGDPARAAKLLVGWPPTCGASPGRPPAATEPGGGVRSAGAGALESDCRRQRERHHHNRHHLRHRCASDAVDIGLPRRTRAPGVSRDCPAPTATAPCPREVRRSSWASRHGWCSRRGEPAVQGRCTWQGSANVRTPFGCSGPRNGFACCASGPPGSGRRADGRSVINERRREEPAHGDGPAPERGTAGARCPRSRGDRHLAARPAVPSLASRASRPVDASSAPLVQAPSSSTPRFVVRCVVCRLTKHGAQYEAAWAIDVTVEP